MEFFGGDSLSCPLPLSLAVKYARQIIEALEYAHECGAIHRYLKPANIKLTPYGAVKLLDFGLAKTLDNKPPAPQTVPPVTIGRTVAGQTLGTRPADLSIASIWCQTLARLSWLNSAKKLAGYICASAPPEEVIDLVGFSLGGLVSRRYIQRLGGIHRVRKFISIGTPHRGTWMTSFAIILARAICDREALYRKS